MIIAIDETGGFRNGSSETSFFVATQLRQRKALHRAKLQEFAKWEATLPNSLKNHRGEIKGSRLSDAQLETFVSAVVRSYPPLLITPVGMASQRNPSAVTDKHKHVQWVGICKGGGVVCGAWP